MLKKLLLSLALTLASLGAVAQTTTYGTMLTYHTNTDINFNAVSPYINYEFKDSDFIAGAYINSYRRLGTYIGYRYQHNDRLSVDVVGVTGYHWAISPLARVNYHVTPKVTAFFVPGMDGYSPQITPSVIGMDIKFN